MKCKVYMHEPVAVDGPLGLEPGLAIAMGDVFNLINHNIYVFSSCDLFILKEKKIFKDKPPQFRAIFFCLYNKGG